MSKECSHDCSSCASKGSCSDPASMKAKANAKSKVKRVIAVMSGKGGVGKSLVTEMLAVGALNRGLKVAVLDADITGPSIPTAFGVYEHARADADGSIYPSKSQGGVSIMSLNLIVDHPEDPVVWRGPILAGVVRQFWTDVAWGDADVMFVDMPPGTGDVPLTVFQSLPVDGVVVVTTPQDLVSMIVEKAVRMAGMMKMNVLGIVENMSSFTCPDCGRTHRIFGESNLAELAAEYKIAATAELPIDPKIAGLVDHGLVEQAETKSLDGILDAVLKV